MPGLVAVGCILGLLLLWLAASLWWLRRGKRQGRLRRTLLRYALAHLLLAALLVALVIEREPRVTTQRLDTADKIALRDSRRDADGSVYRLSLKPGLIARSLRTAAELVRVELHSEIALGAADQVEAQFSLGLPRAGYLNVAVEGSARVKQGVPSLQLQSLRLGKLMLPTPIKQIAGWMLVDAVQAIPVTARTLSVTERAEIRRGRLELVVRRRTNLTRHLAAYAQSSEATETNKLAWRAVQLWLEMPRGEGEPRFVGSTRTLFKLTQSLAPDWPATRQNEAAVLACGIAMGHPQLAELAGLPLEPEPNGTIWRHGATVRAHGRRDLVQHFWVSAGLARVASARFSGFAGLSKEELDSARGGSGFSFADLLADRAGVRFENVATSSAAEAKRIQAMIDEDWQIDQMIPSIAGLPEGLREAEMIERYGGVNGDGFKQVVEEIDRRIHASRMLGPKG